MNQSVFTGAGVGAQRARSAPGVVILQASADHIGTPHVGRNLVELADRDVVVIIPVEAAVVADIEAAVMADHHDARVLRIDPERVIIGMRAGERLPLLAAVERHLRGRAADENFLVVDRVHADLAEVRRAAGSGCS